MRTVNEHTINVDCNSFDPHNSCATVVPSWVSNNMSKMGFLVSPPTSTSQKPAAGPAFLISGCGNFVLLVIQAQNLRSTSSLRFLSHTTSNWSASPTDVNRSRIYPSPLLRLRSNPLLTVPHERASSGCYNGVPQTGCHKPGGLSNGSL